jgi:hypothetical protein
MHKIILFKQLDAKEENVTSDKVIVGHLAPAGAPSTFSEN